MTIIEKTTLDILIQYSKRNDWISFDGNYFQIDPDKINGINMHKLNNLSSSDAFLCLKKYLKRQFKKVNNSCL